MPISCGRPCPVQGRTRMRARIADRHANSSCHAGKITPPLNLTKPGLLPGFNTCASSAAGARGYHRIPTAGRRATHRYSKLPASVL
jgi:hypothetical protein